MLEKVHGTIVIILSTPMIIYHLLIHLYEEVCKCHIGLREKLFMKRFNILDDRHVSDFLVWNERYVERRKKNVFR